MKLFDLFSYRCYKYAPESFELFFRKDKIKLSYDEKREFGNTLLTKGKQELEKKIKRFIRSKTIFSKDQRKRLFGLYDKNSDDIIHGNSYVSRYNIKEHLKAYKHLLYSLNYHNYNHPIKTTKAELNGKYEVEKVENIERKIVIDTNRVYLG